MKRILYIMILGLLAVCANAQSVYDGWYKYPVYSDSISDVVATSNKIYYLSGSNLFSFSPEDNESYSYSSMNKLTGDAITNIYYNYDGKYLVVTYDDCNIDLIYDNGKVVNLPEIRDSQITDAKIINDVAFGAGRIIVSLSFGIVVYDEKKLEVIESGIYGTSVLCSAVMGDKLIVFFRRDNGWFVQWSPLNERHNSIEKFQKIGSGAYIRKMVALNDTDLIMIGRENSQLSKRTINFENNSWGAPVNYAPLGTVGFRKYKDGYYTYNADGLVLVDADDCKLQEVPAPLQGQKLCFYDDPTQLWAGNADGIALYDVSNATPTVVYDKFVCDNAITCNQVGYMRWSSDGQRLYISNYGFSQYRSYAAVEMSPNYQTTNIIENGFPEDVSLKNASAIYKQSIRLQERYNSTRMFGDPQWILEDPDNKDIYYCANHHDGLFVIKRNEDTGVYEETCIFTEDNSTIPYFHGYRVLDVNLDPQGNLWVGYRGGSLYSMLPAEKRRQDPSTITIQDWKSYDKLLNYDIDHIDYMSLFCKKSNMIFITSAKYEVGLLAIDTKGTYDDFSDDVIYHWKQYVDQDGNSFTAQQRTTFFLEDNRGCVWVGTTSGVFEITNPAEATNGNMRVRRIKVPRNDGTNYADYLLDSDQINWMALDPSDRKWIATDNSGLFLVSETGDQILRNYNIDNSPLQSNQICSVECDQHDNTVYVGTTTGLYTFLSDSSAPQEDYSEVYAYPNPVRPEFYGDVTITGLMDNTVVKIADAAGNVVAQTRSEGGMATWNVCGESGKRVKSGVYYVYVSSSDGTASAGAVTKILVIN